MTAVQSLTGMYVKWFFKRTIWPSISDELGRPNAYRMDQLSRLCTYVRSCVKSRDFEPPGFLHHFPKQGNSTNFLSLAWVSWVIFQVLTGSKLLFGSDCKWWHFIIHFPLCLVDHDKLENFHQIGPIMLFLRSFTASCFSWEKLRYFTSTSFCGGYVPTNQNTFSGQLYISYCLIALHSYSSLGDEYRPVTLRKVVLGYPCSESTSDFKFDLSLNYKLSGIIQTYSDCKPTLVVRLFTDVFLPTMVSLIEYLLEKFIFLQ